jgi:hypothetical protein
MGDRGKVVEQERARELRAQGWTLAEICDELGVSKASASLWCRDVEIDQAALAARRRARYLRGNEGARQRGPNKLQRRKQAEIEAAMARGREVVGKLSDGEIRAAALALYAGEGSKTPGGVKLANSDPRIIRFFLGWLRSEFPIEERRLRVHLYLHQGLDLDLAVAHWAEVTGIPPQQFTKPYRAVPDAGLRSTKHPMGCAAVAYSCTWTHRQLMGMIDALLVSSLPHVPG